MSYHLSHSERRDIEWRSIKLFNALLNCLQRAAETEPGDSQNVVGHSSLILSDFRKCPPHYN